MDAVKLRDQVTHQIARKRDRVDHVVPDGVWRAELVDADGNVKWRGEGLNLVVNQGKNHWLGVQFHADTQVTAWYIGLVDNSGWTAEVAGDTLASHSGWNEFSNYSGNRPAWGPGASSGQSITNSTPVQFTMTGNGTLHGVFVCSVASGTSGTLWSVADFGSLVPVSNGDVLKVTYTVNS